MSFIFRCVVHVQHRMQKQQAGTTAKARHFVLQMPAFAKPSLSEFASEMQFGTSKVNMV